MNDRTKAILFLAAQPTSTARLRLDEEIREIEAGLQRSKYRDRFHLKQQWAVRSRDLQRAMLDHQPQIVHFSGHGVGQATAQEGQVLEETRKLVPVDRLEPAEEGLILEDQTGQPQLVTTEALAALFELFRESVECVVLNACYSERQAQAIAQHIPYVIGMNQAIADKAAIEFSVAFYDAIGAGKDIKFAFDLATVAIKMTGINQDHIPVLITHRPDRPPVSTTATIAFSTYNPQTFTGREAETGAICEQLRRGCRIIAIVGMTGVGKTTLAERAIDQLAQDEETLPYVRFSLDDRSIGTDFSSSGAALLRELGEELTLEDQQDPTNLVSHIVSRLQSHPCRLQIDSMERLLKGNEQDGWSEFCDPLWLSLFQRVLSTNQMASQLILTTQDIPGDLEGMGDRFNQFWFCQTLQGLSQQEQLDLFQKLGLRDDQERLKRIGQFYDGHPLVLQVIADEIKQRPFNGNVQSYWDRYGEEFEAATPQGKVDRSRTFRTRVRQRVEQTIESLPDTAKQLLCACSVFRRPVPETFWLEMSEGDDPYAAFDCLQGRKLVEYVDVPGQPCLVRQHNLIRSISYGLLKTDNQKWEQAERKVADLWLTAYVPPYDAPNIETIRGYLEAFDHFCEIQDWDKAKFVFQSSPGEEILHWQLNIWSYFDEQIKLCDKLIEKVSLEVDMDCLGGLSLANNYLGNYQQAIYYAEKRKNIAEKTGNMEVLSKALSNMGLGYYSIRDFSSAKRYYEESLIIAEQFQYFVPKMHTLGNLGLVYRGQNQFLEAKKCIQEQLKISQKLNANYEQVIALNTLGLVHSDLNEYQQAIDCYEQSLELARKIGDRFGEGIALSNLGNAYANLGQYPQAIDSYQQSLAIKREIGARLGEGITLGNLGETQRKLQQYSESLANNQAALQIFQQIGDRTNEAKALLNLAKLYHDLNDTPTALPLCQQALALASELGIPLKADCEELLDKLTNGDKS
nr:tetratricopeptide repeat protein [Leptolyngbya ohadii]